VALNNFGLRAGEKERKAMAVTVTYIFNDPAQGTSVLGSTTPPTANQAAMIQKIVAQVVWIDSDTVASVTHNWGLGASAPTFLDPMIISELLAANVVGGTNYPVFIYGRTNTNVTTITKLAAAGSGGTYAFTFRRPGSAWL
jgi:ribulose 1,5-bisphosphate synthetase/thiazole synthase